MTEIKIPDEITRVVFWRPEGETIFALGPVERTLRAAWHAGDRAWGRTRIIGTFDRIAEYPLNAPTPAAWVFQRALQGTPPPTVLRHRKGAGCYIVPVYWIARRLWPFCDLCYYKPATIRVQRPAHHYVSELCLPCAATVKHRVVGPIITPPRPPVLPARPKIGADVLEAMKEPRS